ncbi:heavy-metal-associated domain-containing protein [Exiguobacterium alkaliphilum]|uniref:heavy-metal-associated domain-containing protein n=1 Tax=Exiguobacterium alkaliphilum TaxID=1428684 RepID=UPI001BADD688|nr:heavy metal-associated domain-containing protein [Exiguobacterium alkaliphilum]QUE85395.1 heavy-metal-associated domain-containing protein [Exiguobacterium alkaliphilum]
MEKKLIIEGMTCDGCATKVLKNLQSIEGVTGVTVSRETNSAVISGENEVSDEAIHESLADVKYNVVEIEDR